MERYSMFLERKNQYCENVLPNTNYRFSAIPIKLPMTFFTELEQNFTIHMEMQKTLNSQSSLEKEEWRWRNQPSWLQIIWQRYSHQDSMVLAQKQKYRSMKQKEIPEINPHTYGHFIFDKGAKSIQWRKDSLFNKWYWENWTATCKRMKLEHFLTPHTKINSKWIKDLNVRPETTKLLEEDIEHSMT